MYFDRESDLSSAAGSSNVSILFSDECCVNVEVSALLEHWLGWDHHTDQVSDASPMPTSWADRLVSHLVEEASPTDQDHPSIWVRKFCSEIGCDVLKKQDNNGKTLLHHLLSGKKIVIFN